MGAFLFIEDWMFANPSSKASAWLHYLLVTATQTNYLYNDILVFFFTSLYFTYETAITKETEEDKQIRHEDSLWQSVYIIFLNYMIRFVISHLFY